jgi:DNA-binding transcriptional LysR family regulator
LVETGDMPQLVTWLRDHRIDVAVGVEPDHSPDLEQRLLFEDELFLVLSATHPWNDGRPLPAHEFDRAPRHPLFSGERL